MPDQHTKDPDLLRAVEYLEAPDDTQVAEPDISLRRRVLNWKTIGSVIFALVLLALVGGSKVITGRHSDSAPISPTEGDIAVMTWPKHTPSAPRLGTAPPATVLASVSLTR